MIPMGKRFDRLERKIERNEEKAHPGYSKERIQYIAKATAGKIARKRRMAVA